MGGPKWLVVLQGAPFPKFELRAGISRRQFKRQLKLALERIREAERAHEFDARGAEALLLAAQYTSGVGVLEWIQNLGYCYNYYLRHRPA